MKGILTFTPPCVGLKQWTREEGQGGLSQSVMVMSNRSISPYSPMILLLD